MENLSRCLSWFVVLAMATSKGVLRCAMLAKPRMRGVKLGLCVLRLLRLVEANASDMHAIETQCLNRPHHRHCHLNQHHAGDVAERAQHVEDRHQQEAPSHVRQHSTQGVGAEGLVSRLVGSDAKSLRLLIHISCSDGWFWGVGLIFNLSIN